MPAIGFETSGAVFGEGKIGRTIDGDVVVIVEIDQLAELERARQRCGFGRNALHQVAICDDSIDIVINDALPHLVETCGEMRFGDGETNAIRKAHPERPRGNFNAGGMAVFGVSGRETAPLTEVFQVVEGKLVTGQMQKGVEQR